MRAHRKMVNYVIVVTKPYIEAEQVRENNLQEHVLNMNIIPIKKSFLKNEY